VTSTAPPGVQSGAGPPARDDDHPRAVLVLVGASLLFLLIAWGLATGLALAGHA